MANILQIGTTNFDSYVAGLKVNRETIVSDYSGRNAGGTMSIDVVAHKWKISVTFKPLTTSQLSSLYGQISGYANLSVQFKNPFNNSMTSITAYTGTPAVDWYRYSTDLKLSKSFTIDFIEM